MPSRAADFVVIAETIHNNEKIVEGRIESCLIRINDLNNRIKLCQANIELLEAQLAAVRSQTDENGSPNYAEISSIGAEISMEIAEIRAAEGDIAIAESELVEARDNLKKIHIEKDRTLTKIKEKASLTSRGMSFAGAMSGDYLGHGNDLYSAMNNSLQTYAIAASLLDGFVATAPASAMGISSSTSNKNGSTSKPSRTVPSATIKAFSSNTSESVIGDNQYFSYMDFSWNSSTGKNFSAFQGKRTPKKSNFSSTKSSATSFFAAFGKDNSSNDNSSFDSAQKSQIALEKSFGLMDGGNNTDSTVKANANSSEIPEKSNGERDKVLTLSQEQKYQNGVVYVERILDVYRDNLLNRGVTSIHALNEAMDALKAFYLEELDKDIQGQPNKLYSDPNYDEMVKQINSNLPTIANVSPGKTMTFAQADTGHVNPNYGKDKGYAINCQSSVVVFEARLRGYDVEVLPCTKGSALETLSYNPSLAWIDPRTGQHPQYISDDSLQTPEKYLDFINKVIEPGNRYTIQFTWKGFFNGGHIVNIDRMSNGALRIKDNQRGSGEKSVWVGECEVLEYLSRMKYSYIDTNGRQSCVPRILRIDNMDFDYSIVNQIMKGANL